MDTERRLLLKMAEFAAHYLEEYGGAPLALELNELAEQVRQECRDAVITADIERMERR